MKSNLALALVPDAPRTDDQLLGIAAIQAMLPKRNDGNPVSRWWITHEFCPEGKMKVGRDCWWWASDVHRWLNGRRGMP